MLVIACKKSDMKGIEKNNTDQPKEISNYKGTKNNDNSTSAES